VKVLAKDHNCTNTVNFCKPKPLQPLDYQKQIISLIGLVYNCIYLPVLVWSVQAVSSKPWESTFSNWTLSPNKYQNQNQPIKICPKGSKKHTKSFKKCNYFPPPMKTSDERVLLFQTETFISLRPSINVNTNFSWNVGFLLPSIHQEKMTLAQNRIL
jgi:hypothetical protein